jgi:hypothetical protein
MPTAAAYAARYRPWTRPRPAHGLELVAYIAIY